MTTYSVPEEIRKKIKAKPPSFCGGFDSDILTLNGDVMRLHVFSCPMLKDGEKMRVKVKILELDRYFNRDGKTVDEGSEDDVIGEFEGYLHNKGGKFFFSEMKPSKPIDWSETAPYPYFRVTFARECDNVTNKSDNNTDAETFPVVVGKSDEPQESPEYEIGFLITKEDGTKVGDNEQLVSYFYGEYSYKPFFDLFDIHTQLDSINLLNITNAQIKYAPPKAGDDEELTESVVASTTYVYNSTISAYNSKKLREIDRALKEIDKLIKASKNPWFQHIKAVNEYYEKLERYKVLVEDYNRLQNSSFATESDCFAMEHTMILPLAEELNRLEKEIHEYLKMSAKPPKRYIDRINRNLEILKRNEKIEEILNNPVVQIMGLLPGAGVVTGVLKLIQGNYFDGFMDVFGSIVTYGSFLKLSRVARVYRKASKPTIELLYSYRYRKLVSSITSTEVMNKLTEVALKQSSKFFGKLFETVGNFHTLQGHIDSIAILHRNRAYILEMTEKAIKEIEMGVITDEKKYLDFLKDLGNLNSAAEFFAHIRVLHAFVEAGRNAYDVIFGAMDEVKKLLEFKEIPGVNEFDEHIVNNTTKLFLMMREKNFEIDKIISTQTSSFPTTSSIVEYFNESLVQYDMFGVNRNADIRYQNTREEMLIALQEIREIWEKQRDERDKWIEENKVNYLHKYLPELRMEWARKRKSKILVSLPESLETRIENFISKLKAQIELREAIVGGSDLMFLEQVVDEGRVPGTNIIYDFNVDFFYRHGRNLVEKYY